jgi:hypothetical protein
MEFKQVQYNTNMGTIFEVGWLTIKKKGSGVYETWGTP